jgi:ribosomal protein S18 acetylase RimI-like enzyme
MSPAARVFVVEDGDAIVASAYVKPNYGGPAGAVANAGFMVDPAQAGRGIGRRLAEHVLTEAARGGYRAMVFNAVVETNPAVGLWRSLGFTVLGTVPEAFDHPVHGRVGLHVMHRALEPPGPA